MAAGTAAGAGGVSRAASGTHAIRFTEISPEFAIKF
jgi:hypothetical protein